MEIINQPQIEPEFADVKNISPNLITQDYLNLMWLNISDLEWKSIASIWWWFWILEMDLAKKWNNVEVIDPIYWDLALRQRKRNETYDRLKWAYEKKYFWENTISDTQYQIQKIQQAISQVFDNEQLNTQQCYQMYDELKIKEQELQEKLNNAKKTQKRRERLFNNKVYLIQNLEDRSKELPQNITLNPSYWENIQNIEVDSKDIIFINHILHCFPNKIKQFLEQADKILSENGKIYIVDYYNYLENLQNYFKTNWTYKIDWWTICWSLKKWEYKEINF